MLSAQEIASGLLLVLLLMQTTFGPDPSLINWREFSLRDVILASAVPRLQYGGSARTTSGVRWRPL